MNINLIFLVFIIVKHHKNQLIEFFLCNLFLGGSFNGGQHCRLFLLCRCSRTHRTIIFLIQKSWHKRVDFSFNQNSGTRLLQNQQKRNFPSINTYQKWYCFHNVFTIQATNVSLPYKTHLLYKASDRLWYTTYKMLLYNVFFIVAVDYFCHFNNS